MSSSLERPLIVYKQNIHNLTLTFQSWQNEAWETTPVSFSLEIPAWPLTVDLNTALGKLVSPGSPFSFVCCQVREEGPPVYITREAILMPPAWSVHLVSRWNPSANACSHIASWELE